LDEEAAMQATSVDLRFKTKQIFEALDRGESIQLLQRGKVKGRIVPISKGKGKRMSAKDHPLFGMESGDKRSVQEVMDELRGPRHRGL
jgi:antitoxin (DNA-binding transcriptional repressor) of toxin-antitoxin stability system